MRIVSRDGRVFEQHVDLEDVTSWSRPDENWRAVDAAGHEHRWYFDGVPGFYRPGAEATTPSLRFVVDGVGYYEDGWSYEFGHYECATCGASVENPRCKADDYKQFVPGLKRCYIDGVSVDETTFKREVMAFVEQRQREAMQAVAKNLAMHGGCCE